jgi:hypothetical protein
VPNGNFGNTIHGVTDGKELAALVNAAKTGSDGLTQALMVVTDDEANAVQAAQLKGF